LSDAQLGELCGKLERLLADWFGYDMELKRVGRGNLAQYFATKKDAFQWYATTIKAIDLEPTEPSDRERWRATLDGVFRRHELAQIESQLRLGHLESKAQAVDAAEKPFLARLQELRSIPTADGSPFFRPEHRELNSFAHWCVVLRESLNADLIFTNGMVLGADAEIGSLNIIARGGVTTGIANANSHNVFRSAAMVGFLPLISDAPIFLHERGTVPEAEKLDLIATLTMHELGHMLLRQAEHFDHPHCVHVTTKCLEYYEWHKAIRANGPCPLPHTKLTHY
jgi:hypothetical protein